MRLCDHFITYTDNMEWSERFDLVRMLVRVRGIRLPSCEDDVAGKDIFSRLEIESQARLAKARIRNFRTTRRKRVCVMTENMRIRVLNIHESRGGLGDTGKRVTPELPPMRPAVLVLRPQNRKSSWEPPRRPVGTVQRRSSLRSNRMGDEMTLAS